MGSHTPLYWSSTTPDLRVPLPARNLTPLIMGPTIYTHVHIKWITAHNKVILTVKLISFPKSHIINLLEIMSNIYIKKKNQNYSSLEIKYVYTNQILCMS